MADISNSDDRIDVRDVIERVEELREERADHDTERAEGEPAYVTERTADGNLTGISIDSEGKPQPGTWEAENPAEAEELKTLESLLNDLCGYGGDHQWEGSWYPVTLIADSHFADYAKELAEDTGAVGKDNASWLVIDWEASAKNIRQDYAGVDYDGVMYWYR